MTFQKGSKLGAKNCSLAAHKIVYLIDGRDKEKRDL